MKAPRSFAVRLVFWFAVLGIGPAAVMAVMAYFQIRETDEEHTLRYLRMAARAQAAAVAAGVAPPDLASIPGNDGETYLVGEDGVILTGGGKGARAVRGPDGAYTNHAGHEVIGVWVPAGRQWIVAEMGRSDVTDPLRRLAGRMLLLGAIAFVAVAGALIWLARRIERSGAEMIESLERAARGEFGAQIGRPLAGPVGDIARALNEMQSRLADREAQIVTQRQELFCQQCEMEKLNTKIRAAGRIKSEFVANMSHEVRTPLHVVLSLSRVLLDEKSGGLNEEQRRQVGTIERNGRALLAMLGDILDFSKIEAGRMDVVVSDVAPGGALAAVREEVLPLAEDKGLRLIFDAAADLPTIETDAEKLHRALLNLAHNAVKFTRKGSVSLAAEALADCGVRFRVADTGTGIAPEEIATIFEPFRQLDASDTRGAGGTGLGLTITKSLVEHLGGRLGVESVPGEGTTFTITLPPKLAPAPDGGILVLGATPQATEPVWQGFHAAGFKGGQAVCRREVDNALASDGVAAIAIDLGMFESDGVDVFRSLARREETPTMFGYWIDAACKRGGFLGRMRLRAESNGTTQLELPDASPLAIPAGEPTDEQREAARAWARALIRPPGEPLGEVVGALVAETDAALRQSVAS